MLQIDGEATASAPATVGNVVVGFDLLGFALDAPRDRVTVRTIEEDEVRVAEVRGIVDELPADPAENTATAGLMALREAHELDVGFEVVVDKGIPLSSGLGGSAASAAASIVAAERLLDRELGPSERLEYALEGEFAASGARHVDNVAPALRGGLALGWGVDPPEVVSVPVPDGIRAVVVRPDREIQTRWARDVLPDTVALEESVQQSGRLAAFMAGCYRDDPELIGRAMVDILIEPHRKQAIPAFDAVQEAAREAGALGCSLSGAGPSLFAWVHPPDEMSAVEEAMVEAFEREELAPTSWTGPVAEAGARIVEPNDAE